MTQHPQQTQQPLSPLLPLRDPIPYHAAYDSPFTIFLARRGYTIKDFAKYAGLNYHHLSHVLSGKVRDPRTSTLKRIADTAGLKLPAMVEYLKREIEWRDERREQQQEAEQAQWETSNQTTIINQEEIPE